MIRSSKNRLRKDYQPLTTVCNLRTLTTGSTAIQVYDAYSGTYDPDRTITPLVIFPEVIADAIDGSWIYKQANFMLTNMTWFANGVDITTRSEWEGLFEIVDSGANKGAISIFRNLDSSESIDLRFEAVLPDNRIGANIPITSGSAVLLTENKTEDTYSISINDSDKIAYNPFLDKSLLWEYMNANNIPPGLEVIDSNSYKKTIKVSVFKGTNKMSGGYTLKMYRINGLENILVATAADTEVIIEPENYEIVSFGQDQFQLDLRIIEKADYLLIAEVEVESVVKQAAQIQFGIYRDYPNYTCDLMSRAYIQNTDKIHTNKAIIHHNAHVVPYPALIVDMVWKVQSATKTTEWQAGENAVIELDRTGLGNTFQDNWLDVWVETEQYKAMQVMTDEFGEPYTDENGNIYIN